MTNKLSNYRYAWCTKYGTKLIQKKKTSITTTEKQQDSCNKNSIKHKIKLHWVLHNLWILPDIEENKPSIAYSNAYFLNNNYKKLGKLN